ncbi:MAG: hypothetical protein CL569_02920 [Alphaproteobacteria bacterium]|nr:hypothetical protein [Alphaproteobacteria bacterium]|tara:strand:- start:3244 stop:3450 length:207 start_codon:yes stop_codon:yes gene_type:complete
MSQQVLLEVTQDTDVDEALVEEIVEASNRGNADEIVEYFHDDGVFQVATMSTRRFTPTRISSRKSRSC